MALSAALLFILAPNLGYVFVGMIPVMMLITSGKVKIERRAQDLASRKYGEMSRNLSENIHGHRVLLLYSAVEEYTQKIYRLNNELNSIFMNTTIKNQFINGGSGILQTGVLVGSVVLIWLLQLTGADSATATGTLVSALFTLIATNQMAGTVNIHFIDI